MPTYILQKDTPDAKAGTEVTLGVKDNYCYYYKTRDNIDAWYQKQYVENNPEWFLPKEKSKYKIIVAERSFIINNNDNYNDNKYLLVNTPVEISKETRSKIKEAIGRVLNEESENINIDLKPEGYGVHVHVWVPFKDGSVVSKDDIIEAIKKYVYKNPLNGEFDPTISEENLNKKYYNSL